MSELTELEKRVKRAREVMNSLPEWAQKSAVFVGGERRENPNNKATENEE